MYQGYSSFHWEGFMKKIILGIIGIIGSLLVLYGFFTRPKRVSSTTVIGGADGPTAIYVAEKVGNDFSIALIVIGVILVVIAVILFMKNRKKL